MRDEQKPTVTPASRLESVSSCGAGRNTPGRTPWFPWVERIEWGVWEGEESQSSQQTVWESREKHAEMLPEVAENLHLSFDQF